MRPDPLFNELANGVKNADEASVRDTYLQVFFFDLVYFFKQNSEIVLETLFLRKIFRSR